ncbi:MAG: PHB depolymerase family esterase [Candidatus Binataceae bacterium]
MKAIASLLIALAAIIAGARTSSAAGCSPFGDPPAKVDHGTFASFLTRHSPICRGGKVLGPWKDSGGDERYACLYEPDDAGKENPLPLVVFLHGSVATADSILFTGLTDLIDKADLGGKRPGFVLLAPQGRYTSHFYPSSDADAFGWDNWYRQLNPSGDVTIGGTVYPENVDAATIDHFVSEEHATGKVDSRRIYMTGWSNGAAMAMLYAMNRPWVAAAAVYSAPNPFLAFSDACPQIPVATKASGDGQLQVFNPHVPLMHVRNACDIGGICPNARMFAARVRMMGGSIDDVVVNSSEAKVNSCDRSCGDDESADGDIGKLAGLRGMIHHMRWPKAWNDSMLAFLRQHPLTADGDHSGVPAVTGVESIPF